MATRIFLTTFSTVPSRLYNTGLICTAAALTMTLMLLSFCSDLFANYAAFKLSIAACGVLRKLMARRL